MSLINPWDSKKGLKEQVRELEQLVLKHEGVLRTLVTLFEMQRRFFLEVTKAANPSENPSSDKNNTGTDSSSEKIVEQ